MIRELVEGLLETQSVSVNIEKPFQLSSGRLSPVYVDCRRLISFPALRKVIVREFEKIAREQIGLEKIDVVAGGETAGIPYAAFLALVLDKPMVYVRSEPKGYGRGKQVEGVMSARANVILVEDLITDGGNKLNFKKGIEQASAALKDCLCVFEYFSAQAGLRKGRDLLAQHEVRLFSLANWDDLLSVGIEAKYFSQQAVPEVLNFLKDPEGWSERRKTQRS
ncbi:orotate phosphoribosyltransferase [Candidatus Acetothermia bacterium]|nr:orotate phosphoribosyltransferase [Candidatus Acetothermia bacterium]MBI3459448.1 orotate phosphoribosyltransferase [Candidatus Acetothermia bacterium]MBI3660162.1 orotate phosphoribosyltransferase [Candidatus Acetothermia bacterium]